LRVSPAAEKVTKVPFLIVCHNAFRNIANKVHMYMYVYIMGYLLTILGFLLWLVKSLTKITPIFARAFISVFYDESWDRFTFSHRAI